MSICSWILDFFATYGAVPKFQPPMARRVFRLPFLKLRNVVTSSDLNCVFNSVAYNWYEENVQMYTFLSSIEP